MLALFDFLPGFCPRCGDPLRALESRVGAATFNLRAASRCGCGLIFQRAKTSAILTASTESEGDLPEVLASVGAAPKISGAA